ncbi:undecaprenyldiphospho-muramoylpentapeptide beta-N-acetylglucosaminyltransferase [Frigoriflavimonas asaccharolytica]|uniref:UDP-N-acetylglucosamine--N-acetylmuramyl-(pentapeptide) pyrophosphoryl-undecaprenol N-acetylglucosamine transferase n=1 Tax=Frigoriflavimonas asaccharolytica TaxID=2735899 RepID=A0A8J8K6M9_9FLAO|nr:undecaprenyldiphospho-muramoylpentapeptide beta-N-acetylglucosaminyltransferase [Frigoriflavimonas asaccharolytica]NRS91128.1 UDP-N-acetylglucosamine--N-acetylmuramyl-(pentapeptide) pyrophosphoryl-undecaprenol N-acetylglucosamine transferase [Frigoriflavimonas asaccharolytica]
MKKLKILMSGGGTGGHIFPAIAIAQEIQKRFPDAEFLFIGANGKMEMEKVPQAGFKIVGLNIAGFNRGNMMKNLSLPFKIFSSLKNAKSTIKNFNPDFAVGTGGFASAPSLFMASRLGIPYFLQEQNSLPGKTNQFLAKKAKAVFTAYPKMGHFFPETTTHYLGNPIRENIITGLKDTKEAKTKMGLDPEKLCILSVGGSLGSKTLNDAWLQNLENLKQLDVQLIWQTGKTEYNDLSKNESIIKHQLSIILKEFISDMALAYSAADIIVSRAGAIAISELAVASKPLILVPFPYAAEDHQTKNAMSLVENDAAKMITDKEMPEKFWNVLTEIIDNETLRSDLANHLKKLGKPEATKEIVDEILKTVLK